MIGGLAAGGIPTLSAYATFFRGLVHGWTDVLSSVPPTALNGEYRVVPYVFAWLGTTAGLALLRTIRVPGVATLGPLAAFGLAYCSPSKTVGFHSPRVLSSLVWRLHSAAFSNGTSGSNLTNRSAIRPSFRGDVESSAPLVSCCSS